LSWPVKNSNIGFGSEVCGGARRGGPIPGPFFGADIPGQVICLLYHIKRAGQGQEMGG